MDGDPSYLKNPVDCPIQQLASFANDIFRSGERIKMHLSINDARPYSFSRTYWPEYVTKRSPDEHGYSFLANFIYLLTKSHMNEGRPEFTTLLLECQVNAYIYYEDTPRVVPGMGCCLNPLPMQTLMRKQLLIDQFKRHTYWCSRILFSRLMVQHRVPGDIKRIISGMLGRESPRAAYPYWNDAADVSRQHMCAVRMINYMAKKHKYPTRDAIATDKLEWPFYPLYHNISVPQGFRKRPHGSVAYNRSIREHKNPTGTYQTYHLFDKIEPDWPQVHISPLDD